MLARPVAPSPPPAGVRSRWSVVAVGVLLLALTAAAAVLRAGPLGPSSLWLDDAAPALSLRAHSLHLVLVTGMTAPGFAALLRGVFELAGFSETAAQALPFALGVAGVPLAWEVARQAGLRGGAVVAAAVVAAAPEHVVYASRVKPYTLDAVLGLLVLAAALAVLRRPERSAGWLRLAALSAAAFFLSAAVAPTVAAAFAAAWWAAWRGRVLSRDAVVATGVAVVTCLGVWAALVRPASTEALAGLWSAHFLPLGAAWPQAAWGALGETADGLLPLPAAAAVAVLGASAAVLLLRRSAAEAVLLLAPLVLTTLLATAHVLPLGGGRTDVHLLPSLALLVGMALDRARVPGAALLAGALVLLAPAPPPYPASDVRPLVEALDRERAPGDAVLVYSATRWAFGLYTGGPVRVEQTARQANHFEPVPTDPAVHVLAPHRRDPWAFGPEIDVAVQGRDRVWLLVSHTTPDVEAARAALAGLGYAVAVQDDRPGAVLQRWDRPA